MKIASPAVGFIVSAHATKIVKLFDNWVGHQWQRTQSWKTSEQ